MIHKKSCHSFYSQKGVLDGSSRFQHISLMPPPPLPPTAMSHPSLHSHPPFYPSTTFLSLPLSHILVILSIEKVSFIHWVLFINHYFQLNHIWHKEFCTWSEVIIPVWPWRTATGAVVFNDHNRIICWCNIKVKYPSSCIMHQHAMLRYRSMQEFVITLKKSSLIICKNTREVFTLSRVLTNSQVLL